jgi:hypothetical protein
MKIHPQAEVYMDTNQFQVEFSSWGHLNFFRAAAGGSVASRYYDMLRIAPDIGHAVCPGENTSYRPGGCLCTYMNLLYSISWSISNFFTSVHVNEFCGFDIVPDIEEKASI